MKRVVLFAVLITLSAINFTDASAQNFQIKEISDKVFIVSNPDLGNQLVIQSKTGLVIFDSFWSEKTAVIFKEEISKASGRDDFSYVINMVDRLDMIGGNAAYQEAIIVGHENISSRYRNEITVKEEINGLIEMWREKAGYSRNRLQNLEKGSEKALKEENWMNKCITMADELENSFSLILPEVSYSDRMTLNIGDLAVNLIWFGKAGTFTGETVAVIPGLKLAVISKAIVYPAHHLAPYVHPAYGVLDVPRWIAIFEEILEGENAVDEIILSDDDEIYSRDLMHGHLEYIRKLWNSVKSLEAQGKTLQEIQDKLSLDKDFAFVKEMQVYKSNGDNWVRPQHELHTKHFFLQGKNLASEILKNGGPESIQASLNEINKHGKNIYLDEMYINRLGYEWMNMGHISEAIEVFKLSTVAFPQSSNAYDSLAEAYMKNGDTEKAIKNYKKSLELNPENDNAKEMLKKLEEK